ncbi:MAG: hypothetical protein MUF81_04005 [Verrucomicrobia bacterium]|jgi:hypothetical protein|nr:hypothetical protein [Verrucomicrobiota bacterium]
MSKPTADPKTTLAELAPEYAKLIGKQDKASSFRRRMIYGRAQSLIRQLHKTESERDAAFEDWQKQATAKPKASFGFFSE